MTDLENGSIIYSVLAEVAELADAHGSGPCGSNTLWVRLPSSAVYGNPWDAGICVESQYFQGFYGIKRISKASAIIPPILLTDCLCKGISLEAKTLYKNSTNPDVVPFHSLHFPIFINHKNKPSFYDNCKIDGLFWASKC